jgi:hypothetical protein
MSSSRACATLRRAPRQPGELMSMHLKLMLRRLGRDTRGTAAIAGASVLLVAGLLNAVDLGYYEHRFEPNVPKSTPISLQDGIL